MIVSICKFVIFAADRYQHPCKRSLCREEDEGMPFTPHFHAGLLKCGIFDAEKTPLEHEVLNSP